MWQKLQLIFPKTAFYIFLFSIPFGTRVLLYKFISGFDEYEAVFIYLSDVLMLGFLISFFWEFKGGLYDLIRANGGITKLLILFLALAGVSVLIAFSKPVAIYNFIRLILLAVTALAVAKMLRIGSVKFENILAVLAGSAVVQSLIGIGQFIRQAGLGLGRLGEPLIGPNIGGAAKIIAEGGKVLRAYGTLPHPNVLAAFLVVGLLAALYLFVSIDRTSSSYRPIRTNRAVRRDLLLILGIFIVCLGLVLSFSRAAWLVGALSVSIFLVWALFQLEYRRRATEISVVLLSTGLIFLFAFQSFIFPRAQISPSEPAVTQRIGYNDIAANLIKNNFLGVGIGNQVLYSVKNKVYQNFGMDKVWQWQPIHNIYLLMASEIGALGLLAFLLFVGKLLTSRANLVYSNQSLVSALLCSLLALGLFDHFLWTIQPGRLMLWLTIGLVMGLTKANERS